MSSDHDSYDQQYIATHAKAHAPAITLEDETPRFGLLDHAKTDLWEESAFALVAESGDHDLLLWTAGYLLEANGRGVWIDQASAERDLMFISVPRSQRGRMTDNNFVRTGWHRGERFARDAVRIEQSEERVVWTFDQQQFISEPGAQPPAWRVAGPVAGLDLDLTYKQIGHPLWNWGPFAGAAQAQRGGYDVFARVDGSITAGERRFDIVDGQGVREHILVGQAADPIRNLPAPRVMWWLYATKGDIGINFFRPGSVDIGTVYVGQREIKFNPAAGMGSIRYDTLEHWEDPRSGYHLPVHWRLQMHNAEATVELDIHCHGRAYEYWTLDAGVRLYCYQICTGHGFVQLADGRRDVFEDHLLLNSFNRTILVRQERFEGALYE
ncbi:hypothetical protein [Aquabacterium sp.]|uniref:hypothetical protein n=1 Tax=Aquabacterium sp. TaxID=1872578 RepID=UPI002CD1E006|nr:hypothetical protein [Aquabacterium sp.]HSW06041.1 hypothetical protein [Aquabacterium sp.]